MSASLASGARLVIGASVLALALGCAESRPGAGEGDTAASVPSAAASSAGQAAAGASTGQSVSGAKSSSVTDSARRDSARARRDSGRIIGHDRAITRPIDSLHTLPTVPPG